MNEDKKSTSKDSLTINQEHYSIVERIINKGPLPNAKINLGARILNAFFYAILMPVAAMIYYYSTSAVPVKFPDGSRTIPTEVLAIWLFIFLFIYTLLVYYSSSRLRFFTTKVRKCLDCNDETFSDFQQNTLKKTFNPPIIFLLLLLLTIPLLLFGYISAPIYTGDIGSPIFLGLILLYATFLHWQAFWMLHSFFLTSSRFGKTLPIKINSFDPDKVGGLSPLSDLSTLAIFDVGLLSLIIIPVWQFFVPAASYAMIGLTSLIIPLYFFFSMRSVYSKLSEEKEKALCELNDEIQGLSEKIRGFIKENHGNINEKEIIKYGQALNAMDIIYRRLQSMHTFPVNWEIIAKIFVSAILPILAVVLDFLLTRLL